jgi:hypothetical protein
VKGTGSGTGIALAGGKVDSSSGISYSDADVAAFNSYGRGSGFVDSPFGGAVVNAAGAVTGTSAGKGSLGDRGKVKFSGSSAANGVGEFVGEFRPSGS